MDRFSKLHPLMHMLFFAFTFIFVLSCNHPVISAVSLICSILYGIKIRGRAICSAVRFVIVILAVVSLFNMLFVHYGETILFSIKNTDFTLEALFYGFNQGMVLGSVVVWFGAFSRITDSERVIYLFRFAPKCALIFSMVLGFIPRFTKKLEDIRDAKLALSGGERPQGVKSKFKSALDNFSALITYSLESSIITADSMEARGYNPKAFRAGRYKMTSGDIILIFVILCLSGVVIAEKIMGNMDFEFEPAIQCVSLSIAALICFAVLELLPLAVDLLEDLLWKKSVVKM